MPHPTGQAVGNPPLGLGRSPQTVLITVKINENCRDPVVTQIPSQPAFAECSSCLGACR
jgi:hypothetical protein